MNAVQATERAVRESMRNLVLLPFERNAEKRLLEIVRGVGDLDAEIRDRNLEPRELALVQHNAAKLVTEADRNARNRGLSTVDSDAVAAALISLCPGLYPIC